MTKTEKAAVKAVRKWLSGVGDDVFAVGFPPLTVGHVRVVLALAENADLKRRIRLARKAMNTPVSPDNENPVHTIMRALDLRKPLNVKKGKK